MNRDHINPLQWHPAVGVARQVCARVFSDGGTPADAVIAFGLAAGDAQAMTWSKAVEVIAERLCLRDLRKAA
ncbi:MAG: hypothetical protein KJZ80_11055 [Hyphomicrobiaceae bacterium]|nr:hypothetical protein [Hyphomicrobiaceae bacterium]